MEAGQAEGQDGQSPPPHMSLYLTLQMAPKRSGGHLHGVGSALD